MIDILSNIELISALNKSKFVIPFHRNSDFIETGQFRASESAINSVKAEFSELINFLHYWANCAYINILNILPRESSTRNIVINHINEFIFNLSSRYTYVEMISTEKHRNLFTFKNCFRKQLNKFSSQIKVKIMFISITLELFG